MDANGRELLLKDEVYSVFSCSLEILKGLGHGLHEKPYENALAVEFAHRDIPFLQQPRYPVEWRST
ncbi:GxxExxY protein, partial [Haloferula sp.]|uniref:GxxExxY protein n=1 Tax=Haloferula sp. TaxID=2497595 RepID=UPI003C756FAD